MPKTSKKVTKTKGKGKAKTPPSCDYESQDVDINTRNESDNESVSSGSQLYEVERLMDHKQQNGNMMYYVKWKDLSVDESSWVEECELIDCNEAIREYWRYVFGTSATSGRKRSRNEAKGNSRSRNKKKRTNKRKDVTDDANLFVRAGKKIKIIKGETTNKKITIKSDIKFNNLIKFGLGFDVHRLVPNKKLYLGGVKIPSPIGTLGHSDGDPVLHAVTDAILGACSMGDIGEKFSDKNKKFKNIRSTILLSEIIKQTLKKGYLINNLDINIITQKPKIQKYKKKIINCIAKICNISPTQINIKGKTTEKLGVIGKEKAIACEVIASVIKND